MISFPVTVDEFDTYSLRCFGEVARVESDAEMIVARGRFVEGQYNSYTFYDSKGNVIL